MQQAAIFWVSLVLCVASFGLFVWQVTRPQPKVAPPSAKDAGLQSLNLAEIVASLGTATEKFAKAGPMATSATLCIFFALMALVSSGLVRVGS